MTEHIKIEELSFTVPLKKWMEERYKEKTPDIWNKTCRIYNEYLIDLLHVLPLLCNSDFFGISEIHGQLIRCGTCGTSDRCDYCVAGNKNPLAAEYEVVTDDGGFLVSRKKTMH